MRRDTRPLLALVNLGNWWRVGRIQKQFTYGGGGGGGRGRMEDYLTPTENIRASRLLMISFYQPELGRSNICRVARQARNMAKFGDLLSDAHQTCHNFVGGIRIFSGKIRINPYHCNMPHAKPRNIARNTVLLFITGTRK